MARVRASGWPAQSVIPAPRHRRRLRPTRRIHRLARTLKPCSFPSCRPVAPMLAKPAAEIPAGQHYEPKWDGFRSIIFRDGDEVEIGSRKERPMTRYFPEVVDAVLANFPPRAVIDGEIVIADKERNTLDFEALQQRIHPASQPGHAAVRTDPGELCRLRPARPG